MKVKLNYTITSIEDSPNNMEKNTSTMNYLGALLKDGGKPFQNSGKSAGQIAREKQFWKRLSEANKRLGLTSSHPSALTYLDLLEDAPANVQKEFLKDAPVDFKERFYKIGGPRRQMEEAAEREYYQMSIEERFYKIGTSESAEEQEAGAKREYDSMGYSDAVLEDLLST